MPISPLISLEKLVPKLGQPAEAAPKNPFRQEVQQETRGLLEQAKPLGQAVKVEIKGLRDRLSETKSPELEPGEEITSDEGPLAEVSGILARLKELNTALEQEDLADAQKQSISSEQQGLIVRFQKLLGAEGPAGSDSQPSASIVDKVGAAAGGFLTSLKSTSLGENLTSNKFIDNLKTKLSEFVGQDAKESPDVDRLQKLAELLRKMPETLGKIQGQGVALMQAPVKDIIDQLKDDEEKAKEAHKLDAQDVLYLVQEPDFSNGTYGLNPVGESL